MKSDVNTKSGYMVDEVNDNTEIPTPPSSPEFYTARALIYYVLKMMEAMLKMLFIEITTE